MDPDSPPFPPVDLAVLVQQAGGDSRLVREVLTLFLAKAERDLALIAAAVTPAERRAVAHGLLGSARAVGAGRVADLAAEAERTGAVPHALHDAVAEARDFVRHWLAAP